MKLNISSSKIILILSILIIVLSVSPSFAQFSIGDIAFGDDVNDEAPAAPIDMLVYLGVFVGSLLGIKKLKKQ